MNTNSLAGLGRTFDLPANVKWDTNEQRAYLGGTEKFQVLDIETYALSN